MARRDYPSTGTVLAGLALLSAGAIFFAPEPVAVVGGLLLALVLPGAAVSRLLFASRRLSTAEWFVLVPAISLALLALGGLALHASDVRLTRTSWCLLTASVAVVAAIVGQCRPHIVTASLVTASVTARVARQVRLPRRLRPLRRVRLSRRVRPSRRATVAGANTAPPPVEPVVVGGRRGERVSFRRAVLRLAPLVLAAAVLVGAGWFALRGAQHQETAPFTALEMVPAFATEAPGPTRTVSIGLQCHERADTDYELRVQGEGGFAATIRVQLRPDDIWARQVPVPSSGRVTVNLYRNGETTPYRSVFSDDPQ